MYFSVMLMVTIISLIALVLSVGGCIHVALSSSPRSKSGHFFFSLSCCMMFVAPFVCIVSLVLFLVTGTWGTTERIKAKELSRESVELVSITDLAEGKKYLYPENGSYVYYYLEDDGIRSGLLPGEDTLIYTDVNEAPYLEIIHEKVTYRYKWFFVTDRRTGPSTRYEAHIPAGVS